MRTKSQGGEREPSRFCNCWDQIFPNSCYFVSLHFLFSFFYYRNGNLEEFKFIEFLSVSVSLTSSHTHFPKKEEVLWLSNFPKLFSIENKFHVLVFKKKKKSYRNKFMNLRFPSRGTASLIRGARKVGTWLNVADLG